MPISDEQLEIWSRQGAVETAKATHEGIRSALRSHDGWPTGVQYEVYLQGSYANSTNIRGDSDVDVVVECSSVYFPDTSALGEGDRRWFDQQRKPSNYLWLDFRRDILRALRSHYGNLAVREGKHSLKLNRTASHLPADIVPAVLFRRIRSFSLFGPSDIDGMTFWVPAEHRQIVNYPKLHLENGKKKNEAWRTAGNYKSVVRMFKNARTSLISNGKLGEAVAPSYFLECLLYNVPDQCFLGGRQYSFESILRWLSEAELDRFVCQNEQVRLFGPTPQRWTVAKAKQTIAALGGLWKRGYV